MELIPVKFRFRKWNGMRVPFHDAIDRFLRADWWGSWEDLINGAKSLFQLPLVFFVVLFVLVPLVTFAIAKNNSRILWRYFKHVTYTIFLKGNRNEAK